MSAGKVVVDISMSLDGYICGPNDHPTNGLGDGGEQLHEWAFDTESEYAKQYFGESTASTGAVVMGRRTYDNSTGYWGEDERGSRGPLDDTPCFVLSHRAPPANVGPIFTFVDDGIESAVEQARAAAAGKNVGVIGGMTIDQAIKAGVVDELALHVVPILLGGGVRLLNELGSNGTKLETKSVCEVDGVTHLVYRVCHSRAPDQ